MNMRKKSPLRCRIACKLIGASPSAMLFDCILGRRSANARKCAKCPAYIPGLIGQGFDEGVKIMRAGVGKSIGTIIIDELHEAEAYRQKEAQE